MKYSLIPLCILLFLNLSLAGQELKGKVWMLHRIKDKESSFSENELKKCRSVLFFQDSTYTGVPGCNEIKGVYKISDGVITFTSTEMTLIGCACMDLEFYMGRKLEKLNYKVKGDTLVMNNSAGATLIYTVYRK